MKKTVYDHNRLYLKKTTLYDSISSIIIIIMCNEFVNNLQTILLDRLFLRLRYFELCLKL